MVQRFSAQLYLPWEQRIPVGKNHTDIVKFASPVDTTYQTVVRHLKDYIGVCWIGLYNSIEWNLKLIFQSPGSHEKFFASDKQCGSGSFLEHTIYN